MQLNIHDSTLKRVAFINNELPGALHYFDDNWHRYLAEGTSTFDFSVNKVNSDYTYLTIQSYISFTYDGEDYLFNVMNIDQDHYFLHIQCENLNLELISEEVGTYSNIKRHSIVWYLTNAAQISDNVLEIGNNPFSTVDEDTSNPILTFDNSETKLARIISICNSFNAEFQFRSELKNDGTLQNVSIDLYKQGEVGQKRKDVTLHYGKNIAGITSKADRTSTFFNATTVTDSKNGHSWLSVEGKYFNSDGQLEFYKNAGSNTAYAPLSRDMFPSQLTSSSSDRYTRKNLSIEATSADSLWDYAVSQFKLYAYPEMTYDVTVAANAITNALGNDRKLDIGDTITIQDKTFDKADGGLILEARVSEQEISFTNPLNNKLKFTNFVRLQSQISDSLTARMNQLVSEATPYSAELTTTNGTQFKNNEAPVSTVLKATVFKGSAVSETIADSYEWFKDGVSIGSGQSYTVLASAIAITAVYSYEATINGQVVGRKEVTLTNVNDGENGISILMNNQAVNIVGTTTNAIATAANTDITAYQGSALLDVNVGTITGLPTGMTAEVLNNDTKKVTINFSVSSEMTTKNGSITIPVRAGKISTTRLFSYSLSLKGETGEQGNDGKAGINGTNGTNGTSVTVTSTSVTYQNSDSGTTVPTGTWSTSIPSTPQGQYRWSKTVVNYSSGTPTTTYLVAYVAYDGKIGPQGAPTGITQSDTEPASKYAGMLWQYTGDSDTSVGGVTIKPQEQYIYDGETWKIYQIVAANIKADTLATITSDLGNATAGSITLPKGETGGVSVKDGIVKTWDVTPQADSTYPDGYSYTSMGAALDSGGITFYSAGYGQTVEKTGVVDSKYKIATFRAIASSGRKNEGTGLVLEATNPAFPLNFIGKVTVKDFQVSGAIDLPTFTTSFAFGYGITATAERIGNQVTISIASSNTSTIPSGTTMNEKIPEGYRPKKAYSVDFTSSGSTYCFYNITTAGAIQYGGNSIAANSSIRGVRTYFTSDAYPTS